MICASLVFFFFFCCPVSRTSPEFQKLLGIAMEMFLLCSDDGESDVRMVADECLNKIIKVSKTLYFTSNKAKVYNMTKNCLKVFVKLCKTSKTKQKISYFNINFKSGEKDIYFGVHLQALMDSNLPRLQLELYKEIKKVRKNLL